jgi:hypothetical protein
MQEHLEGSCRSCISGQKQPFFKIRLSVFAFEKGSTKSQRTLTKDASKAMWLCCVISATYAGANHLVSEMFDEVATSRRKFWL